MNFFQLVKLELWRLFSPRSSDAIYGPLLRLMWRLSDKDGNPETDPLHWTKNIKGDANGKK